MLPADPERLYRRSVNHRLNVVWLAVTGSTQARKIVSNIEPVNSLAMISMVGAEVLKEIFGVPLSQTDQVRRHHLVPAMCLNLIAARLRADWPSGKAPTTLARL